MTNARHEHSAGGVVVRRFDGAWEFVAVQPRNRADIWALPKGHLDELETEEDAALREVREETGLRVSMDEKLGDIKYSFAARDGGRINKKVSFFLLKWESGQPMPQPEEIDDVKWVSLESSGDVLTYPGEREIVLKAAEIIAGRM